LKVVPSVCLIAGIVHAIPVMRINLDRAGIMIRPNSSGGQLLEFAGTPCGDMGGRAPRGRAPGTGIRQLPTPHPQPHELVARWCDRGARAAVAPGVMRT
jgi:hypothetical protein